MIVGLILALVLILILPFWVKRIEHNLEIFLFIMGLIVVSISRVVSLELFEEILHNEMLYFITGAVLVAGIIFKFSVEKIRLGVDLAARRMSLPIFIFLMVIVLGLISSVITAIIAALILVEIVEALPIERIYKVKLSVITCFSIGLGAALTPIGEPLATIVVSVLDEEFLFLFKSLSIYIIPGIIALAFLAAVIVGKAKLVHKQEMIEEDEDAKFEAEMKGDEECDELGAESYHDILMRAIKIFLFVIALELLGAGFKPLINTYVIQLDSMLLYWINVVSAVLDNATLAAAEISPLMSAVQTKAILMGLLISGGMLIPGNIPNIIAACKLNIGSKDWAKLGVPLGFGMLAVYFVILFII